MRKYLIMLLLAFSMTATSFAQNVMWFRTTEYAIKMQKTRTNGTTYWTNWSDWEDSDMNVKFDLTNDVITIYSPKTQVYQVLSVEDPPYDSTGRQVKFRVRDQDGDYGYIRLRIENNGNSQIYVDFSNVSWVYNVRRTS